VVLKAKKAALTVFKLQKPLSKKASAKKPVKKSITQIVFVQKVKREYDGSTKGVSHRRHLLNTHQLRILN
jgi:hypothetical protein